MVRFSVYSRFIWVHKMAAVQKVGTCYGGGIFGRVFSQGFSAVLRYLAAVRVGSYETKRARNAAGDTSYMDDMGQTGSLFLKAIRVSRQPKKKKKAKEKTIGLCKGLHYT